MQPFQCTYDLVEGPRNIIIVVKIANGKATGAKRPISLSYPTVPTTWFLDGTDHICVVQRQGNLCPNGIFDLPFPIEMDLLTPRKLLIDDDQFYSCPIER